MKIGISILAAAAIMAFAAPAAFSANSQIPVDSTSGTGSTHVTGGPTQLGDSWSSRWSRLVCSRALGWVWFLSFQAALRKGLSGGAAREGLQCISHRFPGDQHQHPDSGSLSVREE